MTPPSILPIILTLALQPSTPTNNETLLFNSCENNLTTSYLREFQSLQEYYSNEHIDFFPLFSNYTEKSELHLFNQSQFVILSTFFFLTIKTHPYFEKSFLSKLNFPSWVPFFYSTPISKEQAFSSLIPFICEIEHCIQDTLISTK